MDRANEPTRIDAPKDLLADVEVTEPHAQDLMFELYGADPDVRDVIALIRNPTDRRLAVERMRNLSRDQRDQVKELERDMRMRNLEAKVESYAAATREAIRLQQERCDKVMRGEVVGCRPLLEIRHESETRIATAKEELNRSISLLSQKVAGISAIVGLASAAIGGGIVTVFNWLLKAKGG